MKIETLTLKGWPLNAARILDRMIDNIYDAGGYLVERWPFVDTANGFYVKKEYEPGSPELLLRARSYISFVINETYVYVQLSSNPFMDCFYTKEIVINGTISRNPAGIDLPWVWFAGDNEYAYLTDKEVSTSAERLFEWLCAATYTQSHPTKERREIRKKRIRL